MQTINTQDLEEATSVMEQIYCPHQLRVDPRASHIDMRVRMFGQACLPRIEMSYGARAFVDAGDMQGLALLTRCTQGTATVAQGFDEGRWQPGQTLLVMAGQSTQYRFDAQFTTTSLRLDVTRFERVCANWLGHPLDVPLRFSLAPLSPALSRSWSHLLTLIDHQDAVTGPLAEMRDQQLADYICSLLLQGLQHNYSREFERPVNCPNGRIAQQALALIETEVAQIATVADWAGRLGVSVRSLQASFKANQAKPPAEVLRQTRLARVRTELQSACKGVQVTEVALRWGFFHLGRFSALYKREFGESPSQTLRRG